MPRRNESKRRAPPAYRRREIRGRRLAVCRLVDVRTGKRRDYYLGDYDTDESRRAYASLILAWETAGRRLPDKPELPARPVRSAGIKIAELVLRYRKWIEGRVADGELGSRCSALRVLREMFGHTPATDFGPVRLRAVRDAMIVGDLPHRQPWTRSSVNKQIARIRAAFRWAASFELIDVAIYQALTTVEPLRAGQTIARETDPVTPAPEAAIDAVINVSNRQIADLIRLQLLTGMRPGEAVALRPVDLDRTGDIWIYSPAQHKTAWRNRRRIITLGPKAQALLSDYLVDRPMDRPIFSPAEAEADRRAALTENRKTPASCGNRPGSNRSRHPRRQPGLAYTTRSYCRAVARSCDLANEIAIEAARKAGHPDPAGIRLVARWSPGQLRHNYATTIRRLHGLEAAQIMLGHSSALVTDAVYAERDRAAMEQIAHKVG